MAIDFFPKPLNQINTSPLQPPVSPVSDARADHEDHSGVTTPDSGETDVGNNSTRSDVDGDLVLLDIDGGRQQGGEEDYPETASHSTAATLRDLEPRPANNSSGSLG